MLSCLDARHCTVFPDCCYPSSPVLIALSIADISIEHSSKLVSSGMVLSHSAISLSASSSRSRRIALPFAPCSFRLGIEAKRMKRMWRADRLPKSLGPPHLHAWISALF